MHGCMSFVPLGTAFMVIFGTASAIGSWLVAMAHALWDVITFWNQYICI